MMLLSLQKFKRLFLFCMIVVQQASRNCLAMPLTSIVDRQELQISNKIFKIYNLTQFMHQIQNKVNDLIQTRSKKSYQKAIDYLLKIIRVLIDPTDQVNSHRLISVNKNQRLFSEQKKLENRYNYNVTPNKFRLNSNGEEISQQIVDTPQYYEGNKISFIEKLNKKVNQNLKKDHNDRNRQDVQRKKYKLNRRGLQQVIQIYHQCLEKSLEVIKIQYNKISEKYQTKRVLVKQLDDFWIKYTTKKNESKTFDDLIHIAHFQLAEQFLTVINPFKYDKNIRDHLSKNKIQFKLFYEKRDKDQ